jgi:subtilisin family serine protease
MRRLALVALILVAPATAAAAPSDPLLGEQWAMSSSVVLNLREAWKSSQGAGVTVAVVDSGARLDHPDLAPNIWTNFGETPGNGRDDDANGYIDDVHGVDLTSSSKGNKPDDGNGHGTHVAGIIGAAANNKGVVGVAYKAKLMIIKVIGADGRGKTSAVAEGIRYAAANGARIVNVSLAGTDEDPALTEAIKAANAANVLVVAGAGNDGRNNDARPIYPASVAAPNLVAVAATSPDNGKDLAKISNYGKLTVALAAPGEQVLSASKSGQYESRTGTSMATPHVSGVAALMAAERKDLSAVDLRAQLLQTAARAAVPVSAGYLDAAAAVRSAATAASYGAGQKPDVDVLEAAASDTELTFKIATSGATQTIHHYRVSRDGKTIAEVKKSASPIAVRIRVKGMAGKSIRVAARDKDDRELADDTAKVAKVAAAKPDTSGGADVGT